MTRTTHTATDGGTGRPFYAATTTTAQRARYARRVWARDHIGAVMVPDTALVPMAEHGPRMSAVDCGCGWGRFCDAPAGTLCGATPYHGRRGADR